MRRRIFRVLRWLGAIVLAIVLVMLVLGWRAFGHRAEGARLERMNQSPERRDGVFVDPQPIVNDSFGVFTAWRNASAFTSPGSLAIDPIDPHRFDSPPASGLRVTWLGHSAVLLELEGVRILTDPMWSDRAGPYSFVGPTRWYPPLIALDRLPHVDAVVISHDHYDHLDMKTILQMNDWPTRFVVPLGVGAHLEYWGIAPEKIVELDWWENTRIGAATITAAPARHASGRTLWDRDAKLWAGWSFASDRHRVFFSGDTGPFPGMREIGERLGPFDVAMIEVGQYGRSWPDWHIGPERAVEAVGMLRGQTMLPIHWGLLTLSFHGWTEPIERTLAAAKEKNVTVATPKPGQSFEPDVAIPRERWWPDVPWKTAEESPLRATGMD